VPTAPVYPVALVVEGKPCLVVGGGAVAARKVASLVECGADVTVVAPEVGEALRALVRSPGEVGGSVRVEARCYRPGEAARFRLVVTATGRSEVDCVSRSFCMAIAGGAGAYLDTGGLWRPLPAPPGAEPLQAISCSGATFCAAIDGIGDAYVFDGRSWSGALNGWGAPSSLSCVSATSCVAVGVGASSWNGQGWTKPTPVDPRGLLSAVSCSQASQCVAVDDEGNALALDDGRWSAPRAVTGEGVTGRQGANLTSISCVPGGECTAVGSRGIVVRSIEAAGSAAARWARPVSLGDRADLRGVSCVAGGFCLAVDAAGDAFVER